MQLINKKKPNLKALLTTATCALLGGTAQAATANAEETWNFDTAFMHYAETDRVTATELIIAGKKTFANDKILSLKLTFDTLSGASARSALAVICLKNMTTRQHLLMAISLKILITKIQRFQLELLMLLIL